MDKLTSKFKITLSSTRIKYFTPILGLVKVLSYTYLRYFIISFFFTHFVGHMLFVERIQLQS